MNKEVRKVNGKYQFLLGVRHGESYWLQQASWDCGWYWGLGYVESYRGHGSSDKMWRSHQHFDGLFLKPAKFVDGFNEFFDEPSTLTDREIWTLLELMQSAYTCRRYSDMLHIGGAHITSNPAGLIIYNKAEYERINNQVIPSILNEVYKIMMGKNTSADALHELGIYTKWEDEEEEE